MDFQVEMQKTLKRFPSLEGLVFVDPDGESIMHEGGGDENFQLLLAGAKMPILMGNFQVLEAGDPTFMEIQLESRFVIAIRLDEGYSITAIGNNRGSKGHVREHLKHMAVKFNREIA